MLSMTGVAESWNPSCQLVGCPKSAHAAPANPRQALIMTAKTVSRLNNRIVAIAPSMKP
jgi:hypothetical protein